MRVFMAWRPTAIPHGMQYPVQGVDTDLHSALALQQRLQIADAPDGDR